MKFNRLLLLFLFSILATTPAWADIATEGEQDVYVELLNAKDFPKYKFFIRYQTYHYNMGYQEGPVNDVMVEQGKPFQTGDRGAKSFLYAKGPKGEWKSKIEIGGTEIDHQSDVSHLLDRIKITKMNPKGKVIEFKVVERQKIDAEGKVLSSIKHGEVALGSWTWIIPFVCFGGLIAFFILRRKAAKA
jgi:hypothetical protein